MPPDPSAFPVWNVDPVLIRLGGFELRIYSVCFLLVFALGYPLWHREMTRVGHDALPVTRVVLYAFAGVLIGTRLAHCLLYDPEYYLAHPWQILDLRRGGVASHGAALGLPLALWLYAQRIGYSFVEVADRVGPSAMLGAALVRIGNFFNSEIVGREWTGPWALRFPRHADALQDRYEALHGPLGFEALALPRHPAVLYEAAAALAVLALLYGVERRSGPRRPRGLLAGLLLTGYFSARFLVEYVKEYQRFGTLVADPTAQVIRVVPEAGWTLGQMLSAPFVALGLVVIALSLWLRRPPTRLSPLDLAPDVEHAPPR